MVVSLHISCSRAFVTSVWGRVNRIHFDCCRKVLANRTWIQRLAVRKTGGGKRRKVKVLTGEENIWLTRKCIWCTSVFFSARVPLSSRKSIYEELQKRGVLEDLLKHGQYSADNVYTENLINLQDVSAAHTHTNYLQLSEKKRNMFSCTEKRRVMLSLIVFDFIAPNATRSNSETSAVCLQKYTTKNCLAENQIGIFFIACFSHSVPFLLSFSLSLSLSLDVLLWQDQCGDPTPDLLCPLWHRIHHPLGQLRLLQEWCLQYVQPTPKHQCLNCKRLHSIQYNQLASTAQRVI